ncbi:acylneuraminate cytidylyltransferase family protein [Saccharospirillum impatiens]|uniref:acylneuraminate cytidylyltransferase family protein n=1 Tax=Saccharospirillum impatiens TaxID=169438 RepID=UPI001B7FCAA4|nr:acylneuraminate cytidylyltransferase family protein [Saccharospirillum impatiens]
MSEQKIVALLPMKANSERVKGKNFRDFCGKPLFQWILDSLLAVDEIDQIVINTDARAILAENGLTETDRIVIRDRKPEICGNHVSMNLVLQDDVENIDADIYLMTHTTNPLLSSKTIKLALDEYNQVLSEAKGDSLFSVNKIQTRFYRKDCSPVNHDPQNLIPTQNLEPWFEENSNLYLFTKDSFSKTNARIGANPKMMVTPAFESTDIDTPDDWDMAVIAAKYFMEKK